MYSSFVGQTGMGGSVYSARSKASTVQQKPPTQKELKQGMDVHPDLELNQTVLNGMGTVKRIISDTSFIVYHEQFKADFRVRRIPENENLGTWIGLQTHSNIVTALDSFRAKGPSGSSHHFSMTEMTNEGNPNMYQYIESLNLNLAIDVPRSYLELIYDLAIQLSTALDFAHTAGLVHGQLDLSKVVIVKEGDNLIFKITDFAPVSSLEMPVSSEAAYWPFSKQKQELTYREKLEVLMLKDIYSLGICILEMMIGRFSKKRCSITLDSLPLTWAEFNESTPLIQVLVECIQIDSITQRKGKLAHIRKLLIREFKKFFQRTFYKMEKPFIGKKVDVLNKRGIVALFRGNQEEALHLWSEANDLNDRHFDSKVNFSMHRWATGHITDAELNEELTEFVFQVPGKGQMLKAGLAMGQGDKNTGLEDIKEIVESNKKAIKEQRIVNQKTKHQLERAEDLLSDVSLNKEKYIQNFEVQHRQTGGVVVSIGISQNSEYMATVGTEDTALWTTKQNMIQSLLTIKKEQEGREGMTTYTEGRKPLVAIDNTGTKVILFRGGPFKLTVFEIQDKIAFVNEDCIDVVKELHANGQPSYQVDKDDIFHEIRFLGGEKDTVRVHVQKMAEHFFIDIQLSDGVPTFQKCPEIYQDKSIFIVESNSAKRLKDRLRTQIQKVRSEGDLIVFPEKDIHRSAILNRQNPEQKFFHIYDVVRGEYVKKVAKKSMEDEAFALNSTGNLLIHVEGDTVYFDLIRIPNSAALNTILKPRYQHAETKLNPASASENRQTFRDKIYRDLHTYFMFKADPAKAEKESGVTDIQNMHLMVRKYEEATVNRFKLKANREFMMLQKILLRDAGAMGQKRNLLEACPLVNIDSTKRIEIYDDELTFASRNSAIDLVAISSESHRNFFLLSMQGVIYKYDLVTKELLFQFKSICQVGMILFDRDDKLCTCDESQIRLWDFFDHREEAPDLIAMEHAPFKIQHAFINKNSKEFQGVFVNGDQFVVYSGRLRKQHQGSLDIPDAKIMSAEFSYDEEGIFVGTDKGKIYRISAKEPKIEGNPINLSPDDRAVTQMVRFKGIVDANVFLCVGDNKELFIYAETRACCTTVDFGVDNGSDAFAGLNICDVYVSENSKFYIIGVPSKQAFGVFSFNRINYISKPIKWITNISFNRFYADDLLSSVLFLDAPCKTIDHHFLLWKFDTKNLDHKALLKLDVGLLAGGEAADGETDYGTEGDDPNSPSNEVEKVSGSSCCNIF